MNNQQSTTNNRPEDVDAHNQSSLEDLAWAIEASQGEFSLLLAHCNYVQLRDRLAQQLQSTCQVKITELRLDSLDITLYTKISDRVKQEKPEALMVIGLESVKNIDELLRATNLVREEFRTHFHFPLVLWIDDRIQHKLTQLAFDFKDWGTTVKFAMPVDLLISELQKRVDSLFKITLQAGFDSFLSNEIILGDNYRLELEAALEDLTSLSQELPPEVQAGCDFICGRAEYTNGNFSKALEHYNNSLAFWQQKRNDSQEENYPLREADLHFHIGLCYFRQAARENQTEKWQKAKQSFQQCLTIFERVERPDLLAKFINSLTEVLAILEAWEELDKLAQKAINLHEKYDNRVDLAQDYGLLALVALKQSRYEDAQKNASLALEKIKTVPLTKQKYKSLYWLLLAQAQEHLGQHQEAIKSQEEAAAIEDKGNNTIYLRFLAELQALYFNNKHYLEAYQAKQEQITIKQQSGLIAFVGANRLKKTLSSRIVGRKIDVDALVKRIAEDRYKTTIIYGQSGVGKSSLVEAELIPTLQQKKRIGLRDLLVVYQRVYSNWEQELAKGFNQELEKWQERGGEGVERFIAEMSSLEQIFEQLNQNDEQRNLLTVLIFDQFEEFFFVCQTPLERQRFFQFFARCLSLPFVKIILSLREDYLHLILQGTRGVDLSNINNNILDKNILYYVDNFSPPQATEVINQLTASSPFSLEQDLVKRLVQDLTNEFEEIRPIELQVVGAQLEEKQIRSLEEYQQLGEKPKEILTQGYIETVIKNCGKENKEIAELVLSLLVDDTNNTRPLKTRAELEKELKSITVDGSSISQKLPLVLEILVLSGLVFLLPESPDNRYQLVHDYLVDVILQQRGESLLAKLKQAEEERKILVEGQINSLSKYSLALSAQKQHFDGLIEAIRAAKPLTEKKIEVKLDTRMRVVAALHQAIYGVKELNRLAGHQDRVYGVAFSPDGQTLASASYDKTVKLWNLQGEELLTLQGHQDRVNGVAFSPDGQTLASTSYDNTVKLWNLHGEELLTLQGHQDRVYEVAFSPDSQTLASASGDNTVKLWNLQGEELLTLQGHQDRVYGVAFSPDGQTLASASGDNTVKLWNLQGEELLTLQGHQDSVFGLTFSPDGQILASASRDNTVKLWNLQGEELLTLQGHQNWVNGVAFSPDSQTLASASRDNTVKLWNLQGEELLTLQGHQDRVFGVSFSPDGQTLASASDDKTVKLWDLQGQEPLTLQGHQDSVYGMAFSPDGQTLASTSYDKTVKLWNLQGEELLTLQGHQDRVYGVAFSPDGQTLASASRDGTVKLWNLQGEELLTLQGHQDRFYGVAFSPDGQTLASASGDNTVKLWNLQGEELLTLQGHQNWVFGMAFSPDGQTLASASRDKTVKLWNLQGEELLTLQGHQDSVFGVAFSPDGQTLASTSYDKTVKLWNLQGEELLTLKGHQDWVYGVAFSPHGQTLASASRDGTVKLWNLQGEELLTLQGHQDWVNGVAFSPDDQTLASASRDKTVKLWKKLWNFNIDIDFLLERGCNWVGDYLKYNPRVNQSDKLLCEGIGQQKEEK